MNRAADPSLADAPPRPRPRTRSRVTSLLVASLALVLGGCFGGGQPPAPPPRTIVQADRLARQAAQLQAAENWPAAAAAWARAGQQYQLLHQPAPRAMAWHNEALCRLASGDPAAARDLLERAAEANRERGATAVWWRNQVALLQLEATTLPEGAGPRLARLEASPGPTEPRIAALLDHEAARVLWRERRLDDALTRVRRARQTFIAVGDAEGAAAAQVTEARLLADRGEGEASEQVWRQALQAYETLGAPRGIAVCLAGLGASLATRDPLDPRAAALLEQAVENLHALGMKEEAQIAAADLARLRAGPLPTP